MPDVDDAQREAVAGGDVVLVDQVFLIAEWTAGATDRAGIRDGNGSRRAPLTVVYCRAWRGSRRAAFIAPCSRRAWKWES
ncbi:hypothetical protein A4V12_18245 [Streptomyces noursei]|nr:hypothetical protein A4V12_18245 [Streptomyces noursei]